MQITTLKTLALTERNPHDGPLAEEHQTLYNGTHVAERESNRDLSHEVTVIDAQYTALREVMTTGFHKTENLLHTLESRVRDLEIHGFDRKASDLKTDMDMIKRQVNDMAIAQAVSNQKIVTIAAGLSTFISVAGVALWKILAPAL